jgi:hypothetical protein
VDRRQASLQLAAGHGRDAWLLDRGQDIESLAGAAGASPG